MTHASRDATFAPGCCQPTLCCPSGIPVPLPPSRESSGKRACGNPPPTLRPRRAKLLMQSTTPAYGDQHPASAASASAALNDAALLEEALFEVKKVIVGQERVIERLFVCLLARGHCLLEGVPGLAKTLAMETMARSVGGSYNRIQFTPDLLPA